MSRVLFAWELGGGSGHCALLRPLIEGLVARGHKVYFAAADLLTAHQASADLGIQYLAAPHHTARGPQIHLPRNFAHILCNTGFADAVELEVRARAWQSLIELVNPDLLICEHAPTALLASRSMTARRVVVGSAFTLPPDVSPWPDLRPWLSPSFNTPADSEEELLTRSNKALRQLGGPLLSNMAKLYSEVDASFLVAFKELDHYTERGDVEYLGSWSPKGGSRPDWPEGPLPQIFAYVRPYAPLWQLETLLAALRELGHPTLVHIAGTNPNRFSSYQTPRLNISLTRVNIQQVATSATVAVLNGTAGTTAELLRAGKPVLQIPISLEQAILSRCVAEMGAGLVADWQRPELLAGHLTFLTNQASLQEAAGRFASKYKRYNSETRVAQVVEELDALIKG